MFMNGSSSRGYSRRPASNHGRSSSRGSTYRTRSADGNDRQFSHVPSSVRRPSGKVAARRAPSSQRAKPQPYQAKGTRKTWEPSSQGGPLSQFGLSELNHLFETKTVSVQSINNTTFRSDISCLTGNVRPSIYGLKSLFTTICQTANTAYLATMNRLSSNRQVLRGVFIGRILPTHCSPRATHYLTTNSGAIPLYGSLAASRLNLPWIAFNRVGELVFGLLLCTPEQARDVERHLPVSEQFNAADANWKSSLIKAGSAAGEHEDESLLRKTMSSEEQTAIHGHCVEVDLGKFVDPVSTPKIQSALVCWKSAQFALSPGCIYAMGAGSNALFSFCVCSQHAKVCIKALTELVAPTSKGWCKFADVIILTNWFPDLAYIAEEQMSLTLKRAGGIASVSSFLMIGGWVKVALTHSTQSKGMVYKAGKWHNSEDGSEIDIDKLQRHAEITKAKSILTNLLKSGANAKELNDLIAEIGSQH